MSPPLFCFSFSVLDCKFSPPTVFLFTAQSPKGTPSFLFTFFFFRRNTSVSPWIRCHCKVFSQFSLIYQYSVTFVSVLSHYRWIEFFSPHSQYIFFLLCMLSYFLLDAWLDFSLLDAGYFCTWLIFLRLLNPAIFQSFVLEATWSF